MSEKWWTRTWNPVIGCSHASPGCDHCYAERMAHRLASNPATPKYRDLVADGRWTGKTALVESALFAPPRWRKSCGSAGRWNPGHGAWPGKVWCLAC